LKATTETSGSWDLSIASYDSVFFPVNQDGMAMSVVFKSDGTKMYIYGYGLKKVYQYSLSTAWDLSTASYDSVSFAVSGQGGTFSIGITFSYNGTKMYLVSQNPPATVYQYSLSTAWNLSTASYDSISFAVAGQSTIPWSIAFKPDGTKMYMSTNSGYMYQYSLSTAWNLSTASYDSVSFATVGTRGIIFKPDGTKMYMITGSDYVYQYSLSTAWNLSTAFYDSVSFLVSGQDTFPSGLAFKSDGTKMYVVGYNNDKVHQYSLSETVYATSSTFESDSLEISLSASGDKLPMISPGYTEPVG